MSTPPPSLWDGKCSPGYGKFNIWGALNYSSKSLWSRTPSPKLCTGDMKCKLGLELPQGLSWGVEIHLEEERKPVFAVQMRPQFAEQHDLFRQCQSEMPTAGHASSDGQPGTGSRILQILEVCNV
ncbi:hypothetical protein WISP_02700 [Willisornis vidua]|uniref:Uncharacterized protein n=1 Tax=Willisornis vidua TaxID=1566151 RepID=A0ABQ9E054_9PASS|nr:hypothetical protein WISP_02700 [Willisornis vidua]